jgi:hypothetical protein
MNDADQDNPQLPPAEAAAEAPKKRTRARKVVSAAAEAPVETVSEAPVAEEAPKPARKPRAPRKTAAAAAEAPELAAQATVAAPSVAEVPPARWMRLLRHRVRRSRHLPLPTSRRRNPTGGSAEGGEGGGLAQPPPWAPRCWPG